MLPGTKPLTEFLELNKLAGSQVLIMLRECWSPTHSMTRAGGNMTPIKKLEQPNGLGKKVFRVKAVGGCEQPLASRAAARLCVSFFFVQYNNCFSSRGTVLGRRMPVFL